MAALSGAAIIVFRAKGSRKETKETKETRGTFLCKQTNRQVDKRTSRRGSELHLESVFVFVVFVPFVSFVSFVSFIPFVPFVAFVAINRKVPITLCSARFMLLSPAVSLNNVNYE